MKKVAVCFVCLSVFWLLQTALAQRSIDPDLDGFVPGLAPAEIADATRTAFDGVMATRALHGHLCAVPVLPGPADSFDIKRGLFNVAAGDRLDVLAIDSFRTLNGQWLVHQTSLTLSLLL
jgi:hypothetical protein